MKLSSYIPLIFALGGGMPAAEPAVRLALVVQFPETVTPDVRHAMETEVLNTIRVGALGIQWREAAEYDPLEPFEMVVSVRVNGVCNPAAANRSGALGSTHISDGRILPFVEVDCDHVAAMIRRHVFPQGPYPACATLGRALGRVLAHELYHVLANTQTHGEGGLAKSEFDERDLIQAPARLSAQDRERILLEFARRGIGPAGQ